MNTKNSLLHLGPASIKLAGLEIWVHGRQFPEVDDYWDSNWLNVTVHCEAPGAEVWVSGPIIHLTELANWVDACEKMYQTLRGEADLECVEPELSVKLKMKLLGQISMSVEITPNNLMQLHKFNFDVDQSYLKNSITDCHKILAEFPLKGNEKRR
jgi:hypothetical protein